MLDWFKLKAFADDKINLEKLKFLLERVENIVGKKEKILVPAFSPFPTVISNGFLHRVVKSPDCVVKSLANNLHETLNPIVTPQCCYLAVICAENDLLI